MSDPDMAALRTAYNVAFSAHADCARALTQALTHDGSTAELIEAEATARRLKEEARRNLHAAMAMALDPPSDPPTPSKPLR